MEEKITEHFSLKEFTRSETAERYHIDNTIPEGLKPNIRALCEHVLEPIRAHFGPVRITSGYRCPSVNARVKGSSKTSQHMKGEAADFIIPSLWSQKGGRAKAFNWIVENCRYDQIIRESTWIHISWRSDSTKNRQMVIL